MEQGQMDMAILRVGSVTMVSRRGREDVTAVLVISWQADRQGKAGREKPGQSWGQKIIQSPNMSIACACLREYFVVEDSAFEK